MVTRRSALISAGVLAFASVAPAAAQEEDQCATPPASREYSVKSGDVLPLNGDGSLEITLHVTEIPAQPTLVFFIGFSGEGRFSLDVTDPSGVQSNLMTAIKPDTVTSGIQITAVGEYNVSVLADAPWGAIAVCS